LYTKYNRICLITIISPDNGGKPNQSNQ